MRSSIDPFTRIPTAFAFGRADATARQAQDTGCCTPESDCCTPGTDCCGQGGGTCC